MKKYIVCFLAAVLAISCVKGMDPDDTGVVGGHSDNYNQKGRTYMMNMVDQLFAPMLEELEQALDVDSRQLGQSAHFDINGSLQTPGSVWKVKAKDSALYGMTLRCQREEYWTLSFEGDYLLGDDIQYYDGNNVYPTNITMAVCREYSPQDDKPVLGWYCELQGERTEREGYSCTFHSTTTPMYSSKREGLQFLNTRGADAAGWDKVYGNLYMSVYKNKEQVDVCCLSFEGSPSLATFTRGL